MPPTLLLLAQRLEWAARKGAAPTHLGPHVGAGVNVVSLLDGLDGGDLVQPGVLVPAEHFAARGDEGLRVGRGSGGRLVVLRAR